MTVEDMDVVLQTSLASEAKRFTCTFPEDQSLNVAIRGVPVSLTDQTVAVEGHETTFKQSGACVETRRRLAQW